MENGLNHDVVKLVDEVKLNVGVIGVGNAGGQVAIEAYSAGYPAFVINSSAKDLTIDTRTGIDSFIIGDGRGCGKDREIAKEFLKTKLSKLFINMAFKDVVEGCDIVLVVFATGGGTGSGASPLLINRLETAYPNKNIIAVGIMPKESESPVTQFNSYEAIMELVRLKTTYTFVDLNMKKEMDNNVLFPLVAKDVVSKMDVISGKSLHTSFYGMIDERDMLNLTSGQGYFVLSRLQNITREKLDKSPIQELMVENLKSDFNAPMQRNGVVGKMGIICNIDEKTKEKAKTGEYSTIYEFIGGEPEATYENYSIAEDDKGEFVFIANALSVPFDRLEVMKRIIDQYKAKRAIDEDMSNTLTQNKNEMTFLRNTDKTKVLCSAAKSSAAVTIDEDIPDFL